MRISTFQYLIIKLFQKSVGASRKFHFPKILKRIIYKYHYNYMEQLLNPYFYKVRNSINRRSSFKGNKNSSIIWIFWWQGVQQMPVIVKKCIKSLRQNSNRHRIILINKQNITRYAKLPKIIYTKVKNGQLDLTHFSDILRFNILDLYGGLWVDSTIYCSSKISNKYFNYLYTSGGYHATNPRFVNGRWTEFLIGGNNANNMLQFVDKFLQLYFSENNLLISYFLADYALDYSYNHNLGNYRYYVDNIAKGSNPHLFMLVKLLNKSFNINKFKYITKDTNMFKLTYKKKFNKSGNTYYNKLISR